MEKGGKDRHNWTIPVQVAIVGASGGNRAVMKSGEGRMIYTASKPMTEVAKKPPCEGAITAEAANSVYSELPVGPSNTFTQTFTVEADAGK